MPFLISEIRIGKRAPYLVFTSQEILKPKYFGAKIFWSQDILKQSDFEAHKRRNPLSTFSPSPSSLTTLPWGKPGRRPCTISVSVRKDIPDRMSYRITYPPGCVTFVEGQQADYRTRRFWWRRSAHWEFILRVQSVWDGRREHSHAYSNIRNHDPDVALFEKTVHSNRGELDYLHQIAHEDVEKPLDVRAEYGNSIRAPRRRKLASNEMLFLIMDFIGGSSEGGEGLERVSHRYGISLGAVSNYFRHVSSSLYRSLDAMEPSLIRWPSSEEGEAVEGLFIRFHSAYVLLMVIKADAGVQVSMRSKK